MHGKGHKLGKRSRLKHALVSNAQVCILNNYSQGTVQFTSSQLNGHVIFGDTISTQNPNCTELTHSSLSASLHLTGNCQMLELQTCAVMPRSQAISSFRVFRSKTESPSSSLFCLNSFTSINHLQTKEALITQIIQRPIESAQQRSTEA